MIRFLIVALGLAVIKLAEVWLLSLYFVGKR